MAEQTVNLPATPEKAKSSSSSNGGKGVVPHYLKPSTGSCHDQCKHGTEHKFLTKPKRPDRRKVVPAALNDKEDDAGILVPLDKNKKSVLEEPKPSSDPVTLIPELTKIVPREKKATDKLRTPLLSSGSKTMLPESTKVIRSELKGTAKLLASPSAESITFLDESSRAIKREKKVTAAKATPSPDSQTLADESTKVINREKKVTAPKVMPLAGKRAGPKVTSSSEPTKEIVPNTSSPSITLGDSSKRLASKPLDKSLSAKARGSSSPKPVRAKLLSSPSSSSLRRNSIAADDGKDFDVLVTRAAYKPKPAAVASSSSSVGRASEIKTSIPNIRAKKMLASPSLPLKTSVSRIPSLIARRTKSLKIVSSADGSAYAESEAQDHKKGKAKMVLSEDKKGKPNPVTLGFRRGKVLDLQQSQGNSSRTLRLRGVKVVGDNKNGDAQKRSYKKRGETEPESNGANPGYVKVALKHRVVKRKKVQGLFNNVIEQTVSRLAKTRRSRVEALVGAFETVISLQGSKKSPSRRRIGNVNKTFGA